MKRETEFISLIKDYLFCCNPTMKNTVWNYLSVYLAEIFLLLWVEEKESTLDSSAVPAA